MRLKGEKISHTTIYTWVKEDRQAGGSLYEHLRHKGHRRKSNPYKSASARNIPNRTSIKDRPTEANGNRFGDWEMDLIIGKNGFQAILVLVERSTGYVIIHRLKHGKKARNWPKRSTGCFSHTGQRESLPLPRTMDLNFLNINSLQKGLNGVVVYFADPYASWQKGLVENTNKLIRQYIPKGSDFDEISPHDIMSVQKKINNRPRKKLNYSTPKIEFFKHFE